MSSEFWDLRLLYKGECWRDSDNFCSCPTKELVSSRATGQIEFIPNSTIARSANTDFFLCETSQCSFKKKFLNQKYEEHTISFQTFFVRAFKIVIDSWKFNMLLLYILWDDWPIFMISGLNEQLQQQLEYTLLKPDCHSWWISKCKEWYAIKLCFKLEKNAPETYEMLQTCFLTILYESSISFCVA